MHDLTAEDRVAAGPVSDRLVLAGRNYLVVDPDVGFVEGIRDLLVADGASVDVASSATDAWIILSTFKHRFAGVLIDLELPDGLDFLARVRRSPKHDATDVIVCTSMTRREVVAEAIRLGVRQYLVKPCPAQSVRQKLVNAVRNG